MPILSYILWRALKKNSLLDNYLLEFLDIVLIFIFKNFIDTWL